MKSVRLLLQLIFAGSMLFSGLSVFGQSKPAYVIVHGAWGGSWAFKNADSILTAKGCLVYRPSLTGQGERVHLSSREVDLQTHILDVVNTILFEDLHNVILVGHSYGGMVISGVADSIPDRIRKLVYLDAFAPNNGESAISARGGSGSGPEAGAKDGFIVPAWVKPGAKVPHDVPQSVKTFTSSVSWKNPKTLALPATYILTVDPGKTAQQDTFYPFFQRAKSRGWKTVEMSADHNPQWSKLVELTDLLFAEKN